MDPSNVSLERTVKQKNSGNSNKKKQDKNIQSLKRHKTTTEEERTPRISC